MSLKIYKPTVLHLLMNRPLNAALHLKCVCESLQKNKPHDLCVREEADYSALLSVTILCGLAAALIVRGCAVGICLDVRQVWHATQPPARLHEDGIRAEAHQAPDRQSLHVQRQANVCFCMHLHYREHGHN